MVTMTMTMAETGSNDFRIQYLNDGLERMAY